MIRWPHQLASVDGPLNDIKHTWFHGSGALYNKVLMPMVPTPSVLSYYS